MKRKTRKYRKLNKLAGEVPLLYKRDTIYNMCILINALVDMVNCLTEEVEELKEERKNNGKHEIDQA